MTEHNTYVLYIYIYIYTHMTIVVGSSRSRVSLYVGWSVA